MDEKTNEVLQQQQISELIGGVFKGFMEVQKRNKVKTFSMLNEYCKKGQEKLLANYNEIMDQIKTRLPECEVFVMAYYPINAKADLFRFI